MAYAIIFLTYPQTIQKYIWRDQDLYSQENNC